LNARLKVNKSLIIGSSLFIPHTRGKEFLWGGTLQPLLCECRVLMKIMMMIIVSLFSHATVEPCHPNDGCTIHIISEKEKRAIPINARNGKTNPASTQQEI
jgi:hypothetical protein